MKKIIDKLKEVETLVELSVGSTMTEDTAIRFAKWLQHLDNGIVHYDPHRDEETETIGFSPYDCFMDNIYTVEELYKKWLALEN